MDLQLGLLSKVRKLAAGILLEVSLLLLLGVGGATILLGGATSGKAVPYRIAVLQGIDKVTARVSTIMAPIDAIIHFGTLEIIVRHCDKHLPEELPESAAFMEISEVRASEPAISLFNGWMLASSPALSALEHPVYDIWVLDCGGELDSQGGITGSSAERYGKDVKLLGLQKLLKKKFNQH